MNRLFNAILVCIFCVIGSIPAPARAIIRWTELTVPYGCSMMQLRSNFSSTLMSCSLDASPKLSDMLFLHRDIVSLCPDALSSWLDMMNKARRAIAVLYDSFFGKSLYLESKLIAVTQVAEAIHRCFVGGSYAPKEEYRNGLYKSLVTAVPQTLAHGWRESLLGRLEHAHEYSLRKRLRELISRCPRAFRAEIFQNTNGTETFVDQVIHVRNLLTHYADSDAGFSRRAESLHWHIELLRLVLEVVLLKNPGFGDEAIQELLKRNDRMRQRIELCRRHVASIVKAE